MDACLILMMSNTIINDHHLHAIQCRHRKYRGMVKANASKVEECGGIIACIDTPTICVNWHSVKTHRGNTKCSKVCIWKHNVTDKT